MADEFTGFGSTFKMGNPVTLLELGNIVEWPELPTFTRDLIEKTHFKSPDGVKQYMNSPLQDGAEATFVMNIDLGSTSDAACRSAFADGVERPYEMSLPTANGLYLITGGLIVRNYVRTNPMDDLRKASLTVKWVSLPTEGLD